MTPHQLPWRHVLGPLVDALTSSSERGWLVGGCLRDAMLGRPVYDVDVAVTGDPLALARAVAPSAPEATVVPLRLGDQTVRIVLATEAHQPALQIDLSRLRGATIDDDLRARDFTVNAMALPLTAASAWTQLLETDAARARGPVVGLLDPLGGLADLRAGLLRAASATALVADPLRVLRGVRLSLHLGLAFDAATVALARGAAPGLRLVPRARMRDELWALLRLHQAPAAVALLLALSAFAPVFPEFAAPGDDSSGAALAGRAEHAIRSLRALDAARVVMDADPTVGRALDEWYATPLAADRPRWLALRWAVLLHALPPHVYSAIAAAAAQPEPAPPSMGHADRRLAGWEGELAARATATAVARRMGLSARERAIVAAVATHRVKADHLIHSGPVEERVARRYFAATGETGVDVLLAALACVGTEAGLLSEAVPLDGHVGDVLALVALFFTARDQVIPPPLVDGRALIEGVGVRPGPDVGKLLARVRAAQIAGAITTREEALRLARVLHSEG